MLKAQYNAFREYQERKAENPTIDPFIIHKMTTTKIDRPVVKSGEVESRRLGLIISRSTPDRSKDTVSHTGWVTDNYKLNPVVLWAHDYKMLPVGKSVELSVFGNGLHSIDQFVERDLSEFGDTVYRMLVLGYLNASSVGFDPWEWKEAPERDDGSSWFIPCDFTKQELLEHSIVPVPAHPGALVDAKAKGLNLAPLESWVERTLDEWTEQKGFILPEQMIYAAAKELNPRSFHQGVTLAPSGEPRTLTPAEAFHAALRADLVEAKGGALKNSGGPKAAEGESWDGPGEVAKAADVDALKKMCCFYTDDGENKGDYHLPHHKGDGDHAVVWAGVKAAWGRRSQTNGADEYMNSIESHLGSHAKQFGKELDGGEEGKAMTRQAQLIQRAEKRLARVKAMSAEDNAVDGHGAVSGTHSHAHNAMMSQGDDDKHTHDHGHQNDASHTEDVTHVHSKSVNVPGTVVGPGATVPAGLIMSSLATNKDSETGGEEAPEMALIDQAISLVNQLIAMEAADLSTDPDEADEISLLLRIRDMLCCYADGDTDQYWYLAHQTQQTRSLRRAEDPSLGSGELDNQGNPLDANTPAGSGKKPASKTPGADDAPDEAETVDAVMAILKERFQIKLREEVSTQYTAKTGRLL